jgi:hypothetical protein
MTIPVKDTGTRAKERVVQGIVVETTMTRMISMTMIVPIPAVVGKGARRGKSIATGGGESSPD